MRAPLRFKVVDLKGNFNLQYIDNDDVWHSIPVVELYNEERDRLEAEAKLAVEHTSANQEPPGSEVE